MKPIQPIPNKQLPKKAIILAAGFATRMQPLSRALPKCLLPFWGKPLIDHAIDTLASWGVRDVLINLHHAPAPILNHLLSIPQPASPWEASPARRFPPPHPAPPPNETNPTNPQ